jgi:hypothetical protein
LIRQYGCKEVLFKFYALYTPEQRLPQSPWWRLCGDKKWRFDNKGIGSDQNLLKRKIKEALKSTEGHAIIESLTSSGTTEANRVKGYFYRNNDDGILVLNNKAIEDFIDGQFNNIFKY